MGPPLPQKLRGTAATLGALSILTTVLRCYVRTRVVKSWGYDDTFIFVAFIVHMWYTGTLLTGIHYGTGQRTSEISIPDSVHAMRCWWICFLAYAATITFAKISAGFFFLRISGIITIHRVATYFVTILAATIGIAFFFVSLFQCRPVDFFWTRLVGASGNCMDMNIMICLAYLYGSVSAFTDLALGLLAFALVWNLKVDRRTKLLIAPFLAMACIASYAAIVRMPYIENFRKPDFLYATVDISLWSTVEVGVSVFAANLATFRPLVKHLQEGTRLSSRTRSEPRFQTFGFQQVDLMNLKGAEKVENKDNGVAEMCRDIEAEGESTVSLTKSTRTQ